MMPVMMDHDPVVCAFICRKEHFFELDYRKTKKKLRRKKKSTYRLRLALKSASISE